jgi:5'-nucleotidase
MEAVIGGLPGLAFSLYRKQEVRGPLDYVPAAEIARRVTSATIERGLPKGVLLNVNVPYGPLEQLKGIAVTRQGLRVYRDKLDSRLDPRGRPYYWIGGDEPTGVEEDGTDIGALMQGYVSVTPLHLDLTAHPALEVIKAWNL